MKKVLGSISVSLIMLFAWVYFWTPGLIVCKLASDDQQDDKWIIGQEKANGTVEEKFFITKASVGWIGFVRVCWVPVLLVLTTGSYIGVYKVREITNAYREIGKRLLRRQERLEEAERHVKILDKSVYNNWIKLHCEKEAFESEKKQYEYEMGCLEVRAMSTAEQLENERRDHKNRKDKIQNLEKKTKKLEAEKLAGEREKLALERENLTLLKKKSELETRLRQLAGKRS